MNQTKLLTHRKLRRIDASNKPRVKYKGFTQSEMLNQQFRFVHPNKRKLYSGLFILLKRKIHLAKEALSQALESAFMLFRRIVFGNVRTLV